MSQFDFQTGEVINIDLHEVSGTINIVDPQPLSAHPAYRILAAFLGLWLLLICVDNFTHGYFLRAILSVAASGVWLLIAWRAPRRS